MVSLVAAARRRSDSGGPRRRAGAGLLALSLLLVGSPLARSAAETQMPMCAIDMGSNTFKRIVGSFHDGRFEQQSFEKKTMGVGDDLTRNGKISDAKLAEIETTLSAYKATCVEQGAPRIVAIGTAAFRQAPNGARAVEIAAKLGIPMEIASESRESELAYLVGSLGRDGYAVIDSGSRSVELVAKEPGQAPRYSVFNLGYRVAYEQFFAAASDPGPAIRAFRDRLREEAAKAPFFSGKRKLVGVEFNEMAEILFPAAETEGRLFTSGQLKQRLDQLAASSPEDFAALKQKKDVDRALPRLVLAATLTEEFGYGDLELTERELGTGLIIEAGLQQSR